MLKLNSKQIHEFDANLHPLTTTIGVPKKNHPGIDRLFPNRDSPKINTLEEGSPNKFGWDQTPPTHQGEKSLEAGKKIFGKKDEQFLAYYLNS